MIAFGKLLMIYHIKANMKLILQYILPFFHSCHHFDLHIHPREKNNNLVTVVKLHKIPENVAQLFLHC